MRNHAQPDDWSLARRENFPPEKIIPKKNKIKRNQKTTTTKKKKLIRKIYDNEGGKFYLCPSAWNFEIEELSTALIFLIQALLLVLQLSRVYLHCLA